MIDYPLQKRREAVTLTPAHETDIEQILVGIQTVRQQPVPPPVPKPMSLCRQCAYQELCWG